MPKQQQRSASEELTARYEMNTPYHLDPSAAAAAQSRTLHKDSDLLPDYGIYDENTAKYLKSTIVTSSKGGIQQPIITKRHLAASSATLDAKPIGEFSSAKLVATNFSRKIASSFGKATKLNGTLTLLLTYSHLFT